MNLPDSEYSALVYRLALLARTDFPTWVLMMNPPGASKFIISRFHAWLARHLQCVVEGTVSARQTLSVPPQHGKSRCVSIWLVAWLIGSKPGIAIALTGFSHSLLVGFLREVESIIASPTYQMIFPGIAPVFGKNKDNEKTFSNESSVLAKAAGSKLTGRRVDFLIIDDPHPGRAEAESIVLRKKVVAWYFADCLSRLSEGAKVIIVATRWHPEDLIGTLTSEEYSEELAAADASGEIFQVTNLPAIAGENDPMGREEGEPLFPEQRSLAFLMRIKAATLIYEWMSQYQGQPMSSMGDQVDVAKIRRISDASHVPWPLLDNTRGWDLAVSEKQTADWSVGALCGRHRQTGEFYILHIFRRKLSWPKLKPIMLELSRYDLKKYRVGKVGIEAVAGFIAVLQDVRQELLGQVSVSQKNPPRGGGKLTRAQPWLNLIEAGKVHMLVSPWTKEFISELSQFPLGNHDDQVDAVSVAYEMLYKRDKLLLA